MNPLRKAINKNTVVLIQPPNGMLGAFVYHMPLGLLYTASKIVKHGFNVKIVDLRIEKRNWRECLTETITDETLLVGFSVMSGAPVLNSLQIGRLIKKLYPDIPIVWGGPHLLLNFHDAMQDPNVDFAISGYGSTPMLQLCQHLIRQDESHDLPLIEGLSYRTKKGVNSVPSSCKVEVLNYRDIPYDLIEHNLHNYGQLGNGKRIFSVYSAMGCPYDCAFCSSPVQTRKHEVRYLKINPKQVIDHIEFLHTRYKAEYIYFIDDDSFVDIAHVESIIDGINKRNLKIQLAFRGARINEILKMTPEFLNKLVSSGTDILHIGAESGSQRILDMVNKSIQVEEIIEANLKLSRIKGIRPVYNWLVGLPSETTQDLILTQNIIITILEDNPAAIIMPPNRYRPLRGSELYEESIKRGYSPPKDAIEWSSQEAESYYKLPWITPEIESHIRMMHVASYFIDNKLFKLPTGKGLFYIFLKISARIYRPIATARLKSHNASFMVEYLPLHLVSILNRTTNKLKLAACATRLQRNCSKIKNEKKNEAQ